MRTQVKLHIDGNYRVMRGDKIGGIVPKHTSIDETSWVDFSSRIRIKEENCLVVLRNNTRILKDTHIDLKNGTIVTFSEVQIKGSSVYLAAGLRGLTEVSKVEVLDSRLWLVGSSGVSLSNSRVTNKAELIIEGKRVVVDRAKIEGDGTKLELKPGDESNILVSDVWLENTIHTHIDQVVGLGKDVDLVVSNIMEVDKAKGEKFTYLLEDDVILKNKCISKISGASDLILKGVVNYEKQDN